MEMYLTVSVEDKWGRRRCYTKDIPWPVPPKEGRVVFVGADDDGSNTGLNAFVDRVQFMSDGSITVEAHIEHCRGEYGSICESVVRDKFILQSERT